MEVEPQICYPKKLWVVTKKKRLQITDFSNLGSHLNAAWGEANYCMCGVCLSSGTKTYSLRETFSSLRMLEVSGLGSNLFVGFLYREDPLFDNKRILKWAWYNICGDCMLQAMRNNSINRKFIRIVHVDVSYIKTRLNKSKDQFTLRDLIYPVEGEGDSSEDHSVRQEGVRKMR